ncbi:MAG: hypothetical protein KY467_11970 [Gemmatimonadetes bacterium]|nr:hypothetical protein [Gemmatimonadota bacterium]
MRVLAAQCAMSLAMLAFAVLALLIARAIPRPERRYAYAWALTGCTFLATGLNSLFHDVFSIIGFLGGPTSRPWALVLWWHPVLNHSRTFALTAFCVVLALVLYRRTAVGAEPPPLRTAMAGVLGGMVLGGLVGWWEPDFTNFTHYSAVAVFDVLEMVAFMAVLAVGIASGGIDRALWLSLALNGFILALSVLLFAAEAHLGVAGQWAPRPLHVQTLKAVLRCLMVAVALRHLLGVSRGRPVRGLLPDPRPFASTPSVHA